MNATPWSGGLRDALAGASALMGCGLAKPWVEPFGLPAITVQNLGAHFLLGVGQDACPQFSAFVEIPFGENSFLNSTVITVIGDSSCNEGGDAVQMVAFARAELNLDDIVYFFSRLMGFGNETFLDQISWLRPMLRRVHGWVDQYFSTGITYNGVSYEAGYSGSFEFSC